jgi:hypothetical protein
MNSQVVEIHKVDLVDGEEFHELPGKIMRALGRMKGKLKKSLILTHIFKDHVVTFDLETRKKFRLDMSRGNSGEIVLGAPVEVVAVFVPVKGKGKVEKADGVCVESLAAKAGEDYVDQPKLVKVRPYVSWDGILD